MARHTAGSWGWVGGLVLLIAAGVGFMLWSAPAADAADAKPAPFDGERAMKYLEAVCKIGPRVSGSDGMKEQQKLIEKHFTDLGAKVTYQKFTGRQRGKKPVEMANLIVSYNPDAARRVILCSHYDTRPIADQENNPKRWREPFVSANDGGSGVALLMELGHHMKGLRLAAGVDFVFFDGEEYVHDPSEDEEFYFLGSRHFAREAARNRRAVRYTGAVLLDMVAGKGAEFPMEQNSVIHASKLVREVWDIAAELKCEAFTRATSKVAVNDDHIPLNESGIPAIDIIDFDYPHWHKLTDVPKNCGPKQMTQVAKVCSVWVQRQK
ncbi:MAG: M28 family peptidase [Gemmataceae bacterium]